MKASRPSSWSLRISTGSPATRLDLLGRLLAVARLADRRRGDDPDRLGAELVGEPDLGRDDVGDLGDLLGGDRAVGVLDVAADLRVGALLHHLAELALVRLGDEDPGGVRTDIDRGAKHLTAAHLLRRPQGPPPHDPSRGHRRTPLEPCRRPLIRGARGCRRGHRMSVLLAIRRKPLPAREDRPRIPGFAGKNGCASPPGNPRPAIAGGCCSHERIRDRDDRARPTRAQRPLRMVALLPAAEGDRGLRASAGSRSPRRPSRCWPRPGSA